MKIPPEKENEICKAFYKKLPQKNMFGIRFMEATKEYLKTKKRDTIQAMFMRLSDHLSAARTCVMDAADMGNSKYKWTTPDSPSSDDSKRQKTSPPYATAAASSHAVTFQTEREPQVVKNKPIAKRQPDVSEYPGMDRKTLQCHTCGRHGHNRYSCRNFMNEHCNNTHLPWNKSPAGIEFKTIGHNHFVPFIRLPSGEKTANSKATERIQVPYGRGGH